MKNIAVLIYDITVEYHITIVDGILSFFQNRNDVNLIIAPVKAPHVTSNVSDYQYWTIVNVLNNKDIDSIIVVANSFSEFTPIETLAEELKGLSSKPIISIASPLPLDHNSYVYSSPDLAYMQIIEHLKNKHNRTKFAFFTGELNGSPDSDIRLAAFKKALKANGLKFDKNLVFPGDFSPKCTNRYINTHYNNKEDVPFDALLCANDYMAVGAVGGFKEKGIKVPEDVCVVGFDDSSIAVETTPTITTVNQHIFDSGAKAAELAYNAAYGRKIPKKVPVESVPIYRQSCGCVDRTGKLSSFYDQTGTYFDTPNAEKGILNLFGNALNDMRLIYHMLNMTDTVIDFNDYFKALVNNLRTTYVEFFAACFYNKPKKVNAKDNFVVPKKAKLLIHCDFGRNIQENYFDDGGIVFNTEEGLLPKSVETPLFGNYYILPISIQNMNYGYIISKLPMNKYTVYEIYMKIFINAMVHSYESTLKNKQTDELETKNEKTEKIARTDELTSVLNRRGFLEIAQKQINIAKDTDNKGTVFFCDMDGLKKINDTYGHKVGDEAIKTMAVVLSKACRKSDIVGRLSGDEFAIVAPGFELSKLPSLREKINKLCVTQSSKNNLPVTVSMSMGGVEYNSHKSNLQSLLSEADKGLYEEKEIKHSQR